MRTHTNFLKLVGSVKNFLKGCGSVQLSRFRAALIITVHEHGDAFGASVLGVILNERIWTASFLRPWSLPSRKKITLEVYTGSLEAET